MSLEAGGAPLSNMKLVINRCYGGFSLSKKGVTHYYGLKGRKAYFFSTKGRSYAPIKDDEPEGLFFAAFDIPNPGDLDDKTIWDKHYLDTRPDDRADADLVATVEALGNEANGPCAKLGITDIPDGVQWELDEYDGIETVREAHRSWN